MKVGGFFCVDGVGRLLELRIKFRFSEQSIVQHRRERIYAFRRKMYTFSGFAKQIHHFIALRQL